MRFNPIVKRDITVGSRSIQLAVLITAMNGLLLGVDLLGIFGRLSRYRLERMIDYRAMLDVYMLAAGIVFILVIFLYPALTVGSISGERENGTLDLMLASGLSPFRILSGKLLSKLLPGLVLLASFLPGLVLPLFFGGVGIQSAFLLLLLLVPTVVELCCIGLYAGARARNGGMGALLAYGIVLGILMLPVLAAALFRVFCEDGKNPAVYTLVLCPALPVVKLLLEQVGEDAVFVSMLTWLKAPMDGNLLNLLLPLSEAVQLIVAAVFFFLSVSATVPGGRRKGRKAPKGTNEQLQSAGK